MFKCIVTSYWGRKPPFLLPCFKSFCIFEKLKPNLLKLKTLLVIGILFFLIVNTTYFWEEYFQYLVFPLFILQAIIFFVLVIAFIFQLFFIVKERLSNRLRNLVVLVLFLVITLTIYKPFGIIDFEQWEGEDIMVAYYEGVANGGTTLKLKENGSYTVKEVYFGLKKYKGGYKLSNDKVFFNYSKNDKEPMYKYAVISGKSLLVTFSKNDSLKMPLPFMIIKNNLNDSN